MAEKPISTRQQLKDASNCADILCEDCSCGNGDICGESDGVVSRVAQTALTLLDKVESQLQVLKLAREAIKNYDSIVEEMAISAIDKALGENP